jgi:hypothetical protein
MKRAGGKSAAQIGCVLDEVGSFRGVDRQFDERRKQLGHALFRGPSGDVNLTNHRTR